MLGNVEVRDTGYLKIGAGATVYAGGTITLGEGGGSLLVEGALTTITDQFDVVEPSGGGSVSIAQGGALTYGAGTSGVLSAQLDNDGAIELQQAGGLTASLTMRASSGTTAQSDGVFLISPQSKLDAAPDEGLDDADSPASSAAARSRSAARSVRAVSAPSPSTTRRRSTSGRSRSAPVRRST